MITKRPVATDDADADREADKRSRRSLLAGALGATGVLVAQAIARPVPVEAATNVHLGETNTSGHVTAIRTRSTGSSGTAIQGEVIASTPGSGSAGVRGKNKGSSSTSAGVRGSHSGAGRGVYGSSATGVGVLGTGGGTGVQGSSPAYGVFGYTTPDTGGTGVYGRGADGVRGRSYVGRAVVGQTDSGVGVYGEATTAGGAVKGVWGKATGSNSNGVVGEASNGSSAYGVWGISTAGYAGVFSGKVLVSGILSKGGGSFRIDHPLDPENRILSHSFVESPDMMNVYNGNVRTGARGTATVRLPRYFGALNRDFRYQLTVIGAMAQAVVSREIEDNRFVIRTSEPNVKVSWQVTGIRKDPFANRNRIRVEQRKPASERGSYIHPKAYGKPARRDIQATRLSELRVRTPKGVRERESRDPS